MCLRAEPDLARNAAPVLAVIDIRQQELLYGRPAVKPNLSTYDREYEAERRKNTRRPRKQAKLMEP